MCPNLLCFTFPYYVELNLKFIVLVAGAISAPDEHISYTVLLDTPTAETAIFFGNWQIFVEASSVDKFSEAGILFVGSAIMSKMPPLLLRVASVSNSITYGVYFICLSSMEFHSLSSFSIHVSWFLLSFHAWISF